MSGLDVVVSGGTATVKQHLIDQMNVVKTFFQYAINVNRLTINNKFPSGQSTCFAITVSATDKNPGIPDSDLHLYVVWENVGTGTYAANAGYCILNMGP